jgi:hypothetical protein
LAIKTSPVEYRARAGGTPAYATETVALPEKGLVRGGRGDGRQAGKVRNGKNGKNGAYGCLPASGDGKKGLGFWVLCGKLRGQDEFSSAIV